MTTPTERFKAEAIAALEKRYASHLPNVQGLSAPTRCEGCDAYEVCIDILRALPIPAEPSEPECRGSLGGKHVFLPTGGKCQGCGCNPDGTPSPGGTTPPAQAVEEPNYVIREVAFKIPLAEYKPILKRIAALEATVRDLVAVNVLPVGTSEHSATYERLALKIERGEG